MGRRGSGVAVTGVAIAAVAATALAGAPTRLPDIALHSVLLFHLERVVALLAGCLVVLVTITRGWSGELPLELSTQGLRYQEVEGVSGSAFVDLGDELESVRAEVATLGNRIERLEADA
jgi:hypothetical protein